MGKLQNIVSSWLAWLGGDAISAEDGDTQRRTKLAVVSLLMCVVGSLATSLRHLGNGHALGVLVFGTTTLLVCATFVILRRTGSLVLVASLLGGVLTVALFSAAWIGGGLGMPALYALAVVPLLATVIAGVHVGLFWAMTCAGVAIVFIVLYASDSEPGAPLDPDDMKRLHASGILVVLGVFSTIGVVYERFKQHALDEMTRARAEADRANRAKSEFLAHVSHELRNPMNGVIGLAELLRDTDKPEQLRQLVEALLTTGEAMTRLLDELLDLSKVEAGKMTLECMPFDPDELVESVLTLMLPAAHKKGLTLSRTPADDLPRVVEGDPTRVRQVLLNLVSNAVKFTNTGSIDVRVSFAPIADAPDALEMSLKVSDTGPGMSPEVAARVFDEFIQADASTTRHHGGTGLGLTITRRLCELMDGAVDVRSELGRGSTFHARMRLARHRRTGPVEADQAPADSSARIVLLRDLRVLIADDNAINRMVLGRMVESLGGRAELVADGAAAVDSVRRYGYDCVLMDRRMPGMDGMQATTAIRALEEARARTVPIIAITASAMPEERAELLASGMTDVLLKPVARSELGDLLTRVCKA